MKNTKKTIRLLVSLMAVTSLVLGISPAYAASTSSTLVNTESFFIIDDGDGTTNIELQFGDSLGKTLKWDVTNNWFNFNDDIHVEGDALVDGDLVLDHHDGGGLVNIKFGGALAEYIQWDTANNRFNITDDLNVTGGVTVAGDIDFNHNNAVEMVYDSGTGGFPGSPVEGQAFYRSDTNILYYYDGAQWVAPPVERSSTPPGTPAAGMIYYDTDDNRLYYYNGSSWVSAIGSGSRSLFFAPEYPDTTYYPDTSNNVGTLKTLYDATNKENAYHWATSKASLQDYDIVTRIQLPQDFVSWGTTPIKFQYRTQTASTADNQLDVYVLDTNDTSVTLTGGSALKNTSWTVDNITYTGSPTWTAGDWMTITIKVTAKSTGWAEAGNIVLNYNN